ncbi:hypothetical protein B0H12DRAFT_691305 [Mycena haematopus]|nr:hypothetical protein B0H12DRAFT_691305 [Mycena haematopus]
MSSVSVIKSATVQARNPTRRITFLLPPPRRRPSITALQRPSRSSSPSHRRHPLVRVLRMLLSVSRIPLLLPRRLSMGWKTSVCSRNLTSFLVNYIARYSCHSSGSLSGHYIALVVYIVLCVSYPALYHFAYQLYRPMLLCARTILCYIL